MLVVGSLGAEQHSVWTIGSTGISRAVFDDDEGKLSAPILVAEFVGSSWVMQHPTKPILYASKGGEKAAQGIVAFRIIDGKNLKELDSVVLPAGAPAHIELDAKGTLAAGSHWGSEAMSFVELSADGSFIAESVLTLPVKQPAEGPGLRQDQARPHWADFSEDGQHCFMVDLGSDRIWTYQIARSPLRVEIQHELALPPGFGPRHLDFSPDKSLAVVSGELASQIASLRFDRVAGKFEILQLQDTLGLNDHEPYNNTSEIRIHANGRFVFIGNRGHDSIGVYNMDPKSGKLRHMENEAVRGIWPRNFNIDPSGKWLIVAGQYSNSLTVFAIDSESGELTFNRQLQSVTSPTRVLFGH